MMMLAYPLSRIRDILFSLIVGLVLMIKILLIVIFVTGLFLIFDYFLLGLERSLAFELFQSVCI